MKTKGLILNDIKKDLNTDLAFNFESKKSLEETFKKIDSYIFFDIFSINSKDLYIKLLTELRQRKCYILLKEFNYLFFYNLSIFQKFIKRYHHIKYMNEEILILEEQNKQITTNVINKAYIQEMFELLFDTYILSVVNINKAKYEDFFAQNRTNKKFTEKNFFRYKDISKYSSKTLESSIPFRLNHFTNIKNINIYVYDISIDEFDYLFSIISTIYKGKKFKIFMAKPFKEFEIVKNKNINIYLYNSNNYINKEKWTTANRFILSVDNLREDLFYIFSKQVYKKNFNLLEKRKIYNHSYYVSRRVKDFITLF